ncbi:hypothetical protein [Streptomyces sp. NPDC014894]|uniref:hypothetical protein n=1 Tax=unclassified Streptomyces TaxID=2593676 RepID=UPI0036FD11DE
MGIAGLFPIWLLVLVVAVGGVVYAFHAERTPRGGCLLISTTFVGLLLFVPLAFLTG